MRWRLDSRISAPLFFITLMGLVSLFSDMTHEGARSVLGDFLQLTGASAAAIGFVSGLGELLGYGLRVVSGWLADRSKRYWTLIIVGYSVQVFAVPALALTSDTGWVFACALVMCERIGKAIKKPAKSALVSFASAEIGQGKGFAYQEFLDQLGALLGAAMLFAVGMVKPNGLQQLDVYRIGFLALGVPASITVALVLVSKRKYPHPEMFDRERETPGRFTMSGPLVFYLAAIGLFAFGFADFTLITLHTARSGVFPREALSLLYALAMLVDGFAALFFGWLYDRVGLKSLIASTLLSAFFSVFVFLIGTRTATLLGVVLWGIGMGAQESVMKAAVSRLVPARARASGFGIFETIFGSAWFVGSWLMGWLYDVSILSMVAVSVVAQLLAVAFYLLCARRENRH